MSDEKNRKQRKARYIRAKNQLRQHPDCSYGEFYCNHVYEPEHPWVWVDFRFFHSRLKRYFAVAMVTAEYKASGINEEKVWQQFDPDYPYPDEEWTTSDSLVVKIPEEWTRVYNVRKPLEDAVLAELNQQPFTISPSIEVHDYGPVAVGLWVTVNKEYIDEHVIREFIAFFRSLGEPTTPGWSWKGEEIQVVPARINERFK